MRRRDLAASSDAVTGGEAGGAGGPPMTSVGASEPGWSNFWVGVSSLIGPSWLWHGTGYAPGCRPA
ncbi:MAG: hypothetical protein ACKVOG_00425 [Rhodoglobus sp.]